MIFGTLTIRTTLLVILAILNVLIAALVGNNTYKSWVGYSNARLLTHDSIIINGFYEANKNLSLARGAALSILEAAPETAMGLNEDMERLRRDADASLTQALTYLKPADPQQAFSKLKIETDFAILKKARARLSDALKIPQDRRDIGIADELFLANTKLIEDIQAFTLSFAKISRGLDAAVARQAIFKFFVWDLAENAGREYAVIGRLIAGDHRPSAAQREQLATLRDRVDYGWDILHKFALHDDLAHKLLPYVDEAQTHYALTFGQVRELFDTTNGDVATPAGYPISIEMWLGMAVQAVDSLLALQKEVLAEIQDHAIEIERNAKRQIMLSVALLLGSLTLSLYCWSIVVFRVARPINAMVEALYKATQENIYEMPKIVPRQDEIGKLVRILETFQDNAQKIKRSNEELERFAYIAAHDLKSPLRAVDNLSQWLEEDLATLLTPDNKKHMDELRHRVHLMGKLLDDTLEYASIDAKLHSTADTISVKAMVDEIVSLLSPPPGFTIKSGFKLASIHLPKMPLQQVLYNLVNNALKHHDRSAGMIEIDALERETDYVFTVRDDGPGIAPQYHAKIFEMFQTLKARDRNSGRGMGLAMVRKIVTTYGGKISVTSEAGTGAEFRFTWPKSSVRQRGEPTHDHASA